MIETIKKINDKTYFKKGEDWFGVDKNENEYKVFQPKLLYRLNDTGFEGVGDVISSITKKLGIRECKECQKRKEVMNSIFPFTRKKDIRKLTDEEITYMMNIKDGQSAKPLFDLYNDLFSNKLEICNCPGLQKTMISIINLAIDIQKDNE